jgi:hypothetical protein
MMLEVLCLGGPVALGPIDGAIVDHLGRMLEAGQDVPVLLVRNAAAVDGTFSGQTLSARGITLRSEKRGSDAA